MKTIGKRTSKITKEAKARKLYSDLTIEQKNELYSLLGKISCGEVRNFYSTKIFKNLTKDMDENHKAVMSYICRKVNTIKVFENVDDLILPEEK